MRVLLGLMLTAGALWGSEAEIRKAESEWASAVKSRDLAALEKIYTDDLIYAHSSGVVETKKEYMERLKSGLQRYETVSHESVRVAMHGDTAVALSILRMTGQSNERKFNDHLMMTHVWVKQGGVWRLAAHQTTKLAE